MASKGRSGASASKRNRLVTVDCAGPGLRRRRAGRGFVYLDADGERIIDEDVILRIKALAIPPAWRDVWICPDPRGHIQAVGTDDRGRRQYRYHDDWHVERGREKYDRVLELARRLPDLRKRVQEDLRSDGIGQSRVLACAVRLLELGLFRIGGEGYANANDSYGLATIRKRHVRLRDDEAVFDYPAKGGQRRRVTMRDPEVLDVVRVLKRRRSGGSELLAYKDDRGRWVDLRSEDINRYLHELAGPQFTAKDFRTWAATLLAALALAGADDPDSDRQRRRAVVRAVQTVARQLGNTPQVARSSYVDPRVIDRFEKGELELETETEQLDEVSSGFPEEVEATLVELLAQRS